MEEQIRKFKDLLDSSSRILITSHISPDPDAVSSLLLAGTTLKQNFPGKQIKMVLEEEPLGLSFLSGYQDIAFKPLLEELVSFKPDLFILLDGNNYSRASRQDGDKIREFIAKNAVNTVVVDHHEPAGRDDTDVYINQGSPATAQDVYEVLFSGLSLDKPDGYAQTTMLGLYADTAGFAYENKRHSATFKLANELLDAGANIEEINNIVNQYTENDMAVFSELARNVSHQDDYTYSFIRDEFVDQWLKSGSSGAEMNKGTEDFVNHFIRNIEGRKWGFVTYRNVMQGDSVYSASFRSVGAAKDVSAIATKLGGGGHKPAAGAKFEASSVQDAIDKVKQVIDNSEL